MRKLLFCVSLLALLIVGTISAYNVIEVPEAAARMSVSVVGGGVPVAATCQIYLDQSATNDDTPEIGASSARVWIGTTYDPAVSICVCKIAVFMLTTLGDTTLNTYRARIWSLTNQDIDGALNTELTNSPSVGVTGANWTGVTEVEFNFTNCVQVNTGTLVGITIDQDNGAYDGNYANLRGNTSSSFYTGNFRTWDINKAKYDNVTTSEMKIKIYEYK